MCVCVCVCVCVSYPFAAYETPGRLWGVCRCPLLKKLGPPSRWPDALAAAWTRPEMESMKRARAMDVYIDLRSQVSTTLVSSYYLGPKE